jgi:predicted alpha/beta superfamily hydrolase
MKILSDEPSNTIPNSRVWTVQPDNVYRPFWLCITVPRGEKPAGGWPAVLGTDGNDGAGLIAQAVYYPSMMGETAPSVSVAIGYPMDWPVPSMVQRNEDLTPTAWPEWDGPYGEIFGMDIPPSGDADKFLAFINDELKPAIESAFQVDPARWTLIGHSLGGLFATHALLSDPTRFRCYLGVGSSHWWRQGEIFARAEAFAAQAEPLDISVYFAAGDGESRAAFTKSWAPFAETPVWKRYLDVMGGAPDIVADSDRMAKTLGRRAGVKSHFQLLEDESHGSALFAAYSRGLRWLHRKTD